FVTKGRYVVGFNGSSFNTNAYHCVAADFNGDLWLDVAAIAAAAFDVTILYNLGNGSFQAGTNYLTMSQTGYNSGAFTPFDMELGDANGDQKPDVYVLNTTQNHDYSEVVGVLTNTGNGLLNPAVMSDPGIAWQASIGVGDWNGDTKDDCIIGQLPSASDKLVQPMVSDGTTGKMTLYGPGLYIPDLPNGAGGSGGFSGTQIFNCLFNPSACISQMLASAFGASTNDMGVFDFASGDYDADGDEDVAAPMAPGSPNGNDGAVGIFVNNGNTSFEAPKNKSYMTAVGANPFGIVSGFVKKSGRNTWGRSLDLNADGQPDIAVSANLAKAVSVCVRDTTQAMTASGNYKRTDYPVGIECWFIAGGDFNNDGKYDIATSERVSSTSAGGPGIAVVMGN
ncbi:MAG: VCBS repeat-containing protein, partial [Planctomycetes bacterium]|nr:VCBS repeat-containing protein [Planctomycetota bacterium]